jgi:hypothetical protein
MSSFNLTELSGAFKDTYGPLSENVYNSANVILGRYNKSYDFTGKQKLIAIPQSFQGGVGSGTLPDTNNAKVSDAVITAKKIYARVEIEREAIHASADDKGAWVKGMKWVVQKGVESWNRNLSRMLFSKVNGATAEGDGATNVSGAGTTGSPYVVRLATTQKESDIEEQDFWNYNLETTNLEVVDYVASTRDVYLVGTSAGLAALTGSGPVPAATYFYMQKSRNNDVVGIHNILSATSGSLYGVPVTRRWRAGLYENAASASVTTDLLNSDILEIERKCGKTPKMIVASYTQYRKILNLLEDQKRYVMQPRAANLKGLVSFSGVEYMSSSGPIPIFPERFVGAAEIYYLNDDQMELYHRPGFGWFQEDGTVFLRKTDSDAYEARYGGYLENYMVPNFHGLRYGLAT